MEDNEELVEIKTYIRPDFTHIIRIKKWDDSYEYCKQSFIFSQNLMIIEACEENGQSKYKHIRQTTYDACIRIKDEILTIDRERGWVRHEAASQYLAGQIAEKELLS